MSLKLLHPSDISCLPISTEVEIFVVHHKLQFSTSVEPTHPFCWLVGWLVVGWLTKYLKIGSKDLSDFLHEDRGR